MTLIRQTGYMTLRHLRELYRQPWFIAVALVQPIIWLLLFGALFKKIVEIPGFHGHSYIGFLSPGVVVMTAMFNSAWSGMALIEDIQKGVTARFLVSPVRREALIAGRILKEGVVVVIQSAIIVVLALIVGATFPGGIGGIVVLFAVSALLGATFGALSNGFGVIMRQEEALIGAVQFIVLPLTFLSSTFLQPNLMPGWIRHVSDFNPVNWAVIAGRAATSSSPDWGLVASRVGFLVALLALCLWFATRAFTAYQKSV
ncbi:MAG TPA: ABC transporter permease [Solirubrobacteraceae bacterium]|jgi:ABC-2 type transport system permease protein|nr:ABC transporter permease [Solirubrobacteraceae bacterium]